MPWAKSFREAYVAQFHCAAAAFEMDLLKRGLHRRASPFAWAIRALVPAFFEMELHTVRYLGNARSSEEFRAELDTYRPEYRRHGGILRNGFGIRLSGKRLMRVLMTVARDQFQPRSSATRSNEEAR